jgi:hypothetical protein
MELVTTAAAAAVAAAVVIGPECKKKVQVKAHSHKQTSQLHQ